MFPRVFWELQLHRIYKPSRARLISTRCWPAFDSFPEPTKRTLYPSGTTKLGVTRTLDSTRTTTTIRSICNRRAALLSRAHRCMNLCTHWEHFTSSREPIVTASSASTVPPYCRSIRPMTSLTLISESHRLSMCPPIPRVTTTTRWCIIRGMPGQPARPLQWCPRRSCGSPISGIITDWRAPMSSWCGRCTVP